VTASALIEDRVESIGVRRYASLNGTVSIA
jgi:hypothetical protein